MLNKDIHTIRLSNHCNIILALKPKQINNNNISKSIASSMSLCVESIIGRYIVSVLYIYWRLLFVCINYGREYCIIIVLFTVYIYYCYQRYVSKFLSEYGLDIGYLICYAILFL